jgi:uncharacterized protein (TIGR02246 family)
MIRTLTVAAMAATLLISPSLAPARDVMNGTLSVAESELKTYLLQIIERFNRHEMSPPESPGFTQDADFVNVQGRWMKGIDEIRRGQKEERVTRLKDAQIKLVELDIRFIRPDVAVVHQLHVLSGKRHPDGTPLPPQRQLSTRVLVKEQGQWVTTAFQNTIVEATNLISLRAEPGREVT